MDAEPQMVRANKPHDWGLFVWMSLSIFLIGIDLLTRWWCFSLPCYHNWFQFLGLVPFRNENFAFSLPVPEPLMYGIYGLLLGIIIVYVFREWHRFTSSERIAWTFIASGAFANVGERLVLGYVRDFIRINTGYLNLGDVWIIVGTALILYLSFRKT